MINKIWATLNKPVFEKIPRAIIGVFLICAALTASVTTVIMEIYGDRLREDAIADQQLFNFSQVSPSIMLPVKIKGHSRRPAFVVYGCSVSLSILGAGMIVYRRRKSRGASVCVKTRVDGV